MTNPELPIYAETKHALEVVDNSMEFYDESAVGVRKVGMIDRDMLQEAVRDPRTITATLEDGREVAVLVPMAYGLGAGYDTQRCTEKILPPGSSEDTMLYLPTGGLLSRMDNEGYATLVGRLASVKEGYIFSNYIESDDTSHSSQAEIAALLNDAGKTVHDIPLVDSEAHPGHEEASLSLYGVNVPSIEDAKDWTPMEWDQVYAVYERGVANGLYERDTENGVVLIRGADLTDDQVADMWKLYVKRFQWLGENHPISMEDSKADFLRVLQSDKTMCSIKFRDGKPSCFTDVVGDPDALYWLDPDFLNDRERMHMAPNQKLIYFPGIVADPDSVGRSSYEVIGLLVNVFMDAKTPAKVVFENTNRSEGYIPRIVRGAVNNTHRATVEIPEVLDKSYYKCLRFQDSTTE